jgi:DNA-binding transcriptional MerR regulator
MTRGELAKGRNVNRETIRYYEKRGLLPQTRRNPSSGYRDFDQGSLQRVRFIKGAQSLGFTLEEIVDLLSLRADPRTGCTELRERAVDKIDEVETKIKDLQQIKRALTEIVSQCTGEGPAGECPILECFEEGDGAGLDGRASSGNLENSACCERR